MYLLNDLILEDFGGFQKVLLDLIQQWKMQEIWNPFHKQNSYFEGIFKLWTYKQQELPFLLMFISFAYQNLAVLCVKRISFFQEILMYEVYMHLYVYEMHFS